MAIYSQLSLAKIVKMTIYSRVSLVKKKKKKNEKKKKNVKIAIYSQNGYHCLTIRDKVILLFLMLKGWGIIFSDILAYSAFCGLHF